MVTTILPSDSIIMFRFYTFPQICSQIKCILQEVIALEINYLGGYFLSTFFLVELLFYKVIGWGFLNILSE